MIILPTTPRRAWLMSFWLAICILSGLLFAALTSLLVSPRWFGLGVIVGLGLALPGFLRPQAISILYNVWNRLARTFARAGRLSVMGICFYVILAAVGRTGSSLRLDRPTAGKSLWVPRTTLAPRAYPHQYDNTTKDPRQRGWIATFLSWARESGNWWALPLLPFLVLLSTLDEDTHKIFPANIYTLF